MPKTHLLPAVCAVALLAAVPAFAQGTMQGNGMQGQGSDSNAAGMTTGSGGGGMSDQDMSGMSRHSGMRATRGDRRPDAQNADVDHLNEQSLQAAQQGQSFNGSMGSAATMPASGSAPGMSPGPSSGMGGPGTMHGGSAAPGTPPAR